MIDTDLFGKVPQSPKLQSKASKRRLTEARQAAAYAAIPKAIHILGQARDAAAPFERAFWIAHRELEQASASKSSLTKTELFAAYDRRMYAGHAWHPYRTAVQNAESWISALQKEIKECDTALGE